MYTYLVCENNHFSLPVACFDTRKDLCKFLGVTSRQITQAKYRQGAYTFDPLFMCGYIIYHIKL